MYALSYYSVFLVVLVMVNRRLGSYFYPFMVVSSVVGIISVIVGLTYPKWEEEQEKHFKTIAYDLPIVEKLIFNMIIVFFKIMVILYWPVNRSLKAYAVSVAWVLIYGIIILFKSKNKNIM